MTITRKFISTNTVLAVLLGLGLVLTFGCKKENAKPDETKVTPSDTTPVITGIVGGNYGEPNQTFTVTGRNFSNDFRESKIMFGTMVAPAIWGDDTFIQAAVPDDAPPGSVGITIITNGKSIVYEHMGFTVEPPNPQIMLTYLTNMAGMRGSKIALYGKSFSTVLANNKVTINGVTADIDSVNYGAVYFTVPAGAATGKLMLTTHGKALTYPQDFRVLSSTFTTISSTGPKNISVDAAGNVYGMVGNTVVKITPNGVSTVLATIGGSGFILGSSVVDAAGNIYVSSGADYNTTGKYAYTENSSKIYKISPGGAVSVFAGSTQGFADGQGASAKFMAPTNLALNVSTGDLYVNDAQVIRKITPTGVVSTFAGHNLFSGSGDVLINGLIQYDGQGPVARFIGIYSMAVDAATGNLYVSDAPNAWIRKITPGGLVSTLTIAPEGGAPGGSLFPASSAEITNMAVDASGSIFVGSNTGIYKIKDGVSSNTYLNPSAGRILGMALDGTGNIYLSATKLYLKDNDNDKYAVYKVKQ